jgi:hypothetical protein
MDIFCILSFFILYHLLDILQFNWHTSYSPFLMVCNNLWCCHVMIQLSPGQSLEHFFLFDSWIWWHLTTVIWKLIICSIYFIWKYLAMKFYWSDVNIPTILFTMSNDMLLHFRAKTILFGSCEWCIVPNQIFESPLRQL